MTKTNNQKVTSDSCECQTKKVIFLPCSGASNCGQIANQTAIKLTDEGVGKMYCLAGLGAHISGMIESAKSADRILVIDGCQIACGRKTVENAGLVVTDWLCITDLGIDKMHHFNITTQEVMAVSRRAKEMLSVAPKSQK